MANPIELLIQLQADRGRSKANLDSYLNEIRKRFEKNSIPVSIDTAASGARLIKLIESAKQLEKELSKVGSVSNGRLETFTKAINGIGNSSASTQTKIFQLERAIQSVQNVSSGLKFDGKYADGIQRATANLNTLDSKIRSMEQNKKIKFDASELADAKNRADALRQSLSQVSNPTQLQDLNRQFRTLSNEVNNLQGRSTAFGNSLSEAFRKFPVWMLASSAFFLPVRGIQDLTKQVIELDTAIVSLSRVSDLSNFQLNQVLEKSIQNVDTLSSKTSEYLELVNEFARTGKNDTESLALANTASILQNISDLNAKESFDSLTAAQIAFNIEAEKSITIADKLNEVKC